VLLYDDILTTATKAHELRTIPAELERVGGVYECSNVVEYFFADSQEEYWPATKFPCCVPPHPVTWLESKRPSRIVSEVHGTQRWSGPERWGFLMYRHDLQLFFKGRPEPWIWAERGSVQFEVPREARWLLHTYSFFDMHNQLVPSGESRILLDERGNILKFKALGPVLDRSRREQNGLTVLDDRLNDGVPHEWFYTPPPFVTEHTDMGAVINDFAHEVRRLSEPIWLALSFLHCSNTVVEEGVHPRPERRRALRDKRTLTRFKVLRVEPVTHVMHEPREGTSPTEPGHVSLHIRRGHMRDYRDGKGLFGRIHKLVWYEQMRVGSAKAGEVKKTYEVAP
jgi:hypothetical protein